jgi:REP element-mobilizing transposase RayT
MRDPRIAKIVTETIRHFQRDRNDLFAWCVMPNHVHAVFSPVAPHKLETILHLWKFFSGQSANRLLARSGRFWQRE